MKVVLFCGGLGLRLRDHAQAIPKPMVCIGTRPILWHVMKYYAHHGHNDFVLCLGHHGEIIRDFFRTCEDEDVARWTITCMDTGLGANIGQRLKAVEALVAGEETFLANYTDAVTDFPLPRLVERFRTGGYVGCFLSVRPTQSFHLARSSAEGVVTGVEAISRAGLWMNGGYFVFSREIFRAIHDGEELVEQPFERLIAGRRLGTVRYDGFWMNMDTFKDKQMLDNLYERGGRPWEIWSRDPRC